jgi:D-alanyl-D-alanine carboxypeptidase (penicillin-binding protein 5/6)
MVTRLPPAAPGPSVPERTPEPAANRQLTRSQIQAARAGSGRGRSGSGGGRPAPGAAGHGGREKARRSRRIRWRRLATTAAVLVVIAAAVTFVVVRSGRPPTVEHPMATVATNLPVMTPLPAATVSLPWPAGLQSAVSIPAVGYTADSGPQHPVPIASMTKIMTAYVVLHDHPLTPGDDGPAITITADDASNYSTDLGSDQASVPLVAGEVMTERQMLGAMLVHSANDLAYSVACWDAGSLAAFVTKMNTAAASLDMTQTHYADASGYTPQSVSTPADLLKVADADMANPTFAVMVAQSSAPLPTGATVYTYTPLLASSGGVPGVVGVKSGFTSAAGGGDILAYEPAVGGHSFVVLAAVTSMEVPTVLDAAGRADLAVAQAAAAHVGAVSLPAAGTHVGTATVAGKAVPIATTASGSVLAWPGGKIDETMVVSHRPAGGDHAGTPVGSVHVRVGTQHVAVPVQTAGRLPVVTVYHHLF